MPTFLKKCKEINANANFHRNQALSLFSIYSLLTLCKKSEKINEPMSKQTNKQTKEWSVKQMNKRMNKQTK